MSCFFISCFQRQMKVRKTQIGAASWLKLNSIWRSWKSWVYIKRLFHKWFALLIFFSLNFFSVPFPGTCIIDSLYSQMLWDKPLQDFFPSACWGLTLGNFLRIEERESWCQMGGVIKRRFQNNKHSGSWFATCHIHVQSRLSLYVITWEKFRVSKTALCREIQCLSNPSHSFGDRYS